MLCMIGSAVFIIHSIALAFLYKHNLELCKSKRSMQVTPADTREGAVYHQGNSAELEKFGREGNVLRKCENQHCRRCSLIVIADIVSFAVCLVLNLAGYSLLASTYNKEE